MVDFGEKNISLVVVYSHPWTYSFSLLTKSVFAPTKRLFGLSFS